MGKNENITDSIVDYVSQSGDLLTQAALRIKGIEVTQAIQYYHAHEHLQDEKDRGADNSLGLVALKPARVRVYVRSGIQPSPLVTGRLRVFRRNHGFVFQEIEVLQPELGNVVAKSDRDYVTERGGNYTTLNFAVPAHLMCGHLRFQAEVEGPGNHKASRQQDVNVTLKQTLRIRVVPIAYSGPDANNQHIERQAPTLADAQATAAFALQIYPVESTPDITLTGQFLLDYPLADLNGPPEPNKLVGWERFFADLYALKFDVNKEDPAVFYYALIPDGVPCEPPGNSIGLDFGAIAGGFVNEDVTMAHELGHLLGYLHAPCPANINQMDLDYPEYEPYGLASIGEYGVNVDTGAIRSPQFCEDFMSYCNPAWISLRNHKRSVGNPLLLPTYVCNDAQWEDQYKDHDPWWWLKGPGPKHKPVVSIIGVQNANGAIEVRSVRNVETVSAVWRGSSSGLIAEVLDSDGKVLASVEAWRGKTKGCGACGCDDSESWLFQAFLPQFEHASALRISRDGHESWRIARPEQMPKAPKLRAEVTKSGKRLRVRWDLDSADQNCLVEIRYVFRKAKDTEPRLLNLARGSGKTKIDLSNIPSGRIRLEAIVQNGFDTVCSEPFDIEIPPRPPMLAILSIVPEQRLAAGHTIRLHGLATADNGQPFPAEACVWETDGEVVAHGLDCWISAPAPGKHILSLRAENRHGTAKRTIAFETMYAGIDKV